MILYLGSVSTLVNILFIFVISDLRTAVRSLCPARYVGGERLNFYGPEDKGEPGAHKVAEASEVWEYFRKGWSVRILHPQRWCDKLWRVMSRLEDFFYQGIGCNAYLTPAASQGFAPHWDDIDAFIVQLEGRKRWGPASYRASSVH